MRRFPGQALRLGIAPTAVSLLRTSRWGGQRIAVVAEHALPQDAPAQQVADGLRAVLADGGWSRWPKPCVPCWKGRTWPAGPSASCWPMNCAGCGR